MAVVVDGAIKSAIMSAMRDAVAGGTLDILSETGAVLVSFKLDDSGGSVSGPAWTIGIVAPNVGALVGGRADRARINDRSGAPRITGLNVGMRGEEADVVLSNTQINKSQRVSLDGEQVIEHA